MCSIRARRLFLAGLLLLILPCVVAAVIAYRFVGPSPARRKPETGPAKAGLSARTLESGSQERCYLLYVPADLDPIEPVPLVVSLHGFASNGAMQARMPRWNRIADGEGFLVAYPDGTTPPLRWNIADTLEVSDADDVQFFRDLVADVRELMDIDPARVYVNGLSNGGAMASRIGCEAADVVAAVGTVAAMTLDTTEGCTPSRPVPVIAFHGTADPLVRYQGGTYGFASRSIEYPPVETWIAGWAARNGCGLTPETIPSTGDARGKRYTGCQGDAEVILYTIDQGGHTWPGTSAIPFVGKTSQDIDASARMWEFFQAHPLEGQE